MVATRKMVEGKLTTEEYEVVLKALGVYQIQLFDNLKQIETGKDKGSNASFQVESNLVSSAIKKIHRDLEELSRSELSGTKLVGGS
jgi:hypothetical protein